MSFNQFSLFPIIILTGLGLANFANAHEYWIEPAAYEFEDGNIEGFLRNGQNFKGSAFPFIKDNFDIFTITNSKGVTQVENKIGNSPALDMPATVPGLNIASYQNKFDTLRFSKWEKFTTYLESEGLNEFAEKHIKRGLLKEGFVEQYARCAKALFQFGEGEGADQLTGMKFEFVADQNPYKLEASDKLTFTLYWEEKPLVARQVQLFAYDGDLEVTKFTTDKDGKVTIPLTGGGKFLLSAVHMIEGDDDPETPTAEWQSYWASLVFGIRGTDAVLQDAQNAN